MGLTRGAHLRLQSSAQRCVAHLKTALSKTQLLGLLDDSFVMDKKSSAPLALTGLHQIGAPLGLALRPSCSPQAEDEAPRGTRGPLVGRLQLVLVRTAGSTRRQPGGVLAQLVECSAGLEQAIARLGNSVGMAGQMLSRQNFVFDSRYMAMSCKMH